MIRASSHPTVKPGSHMHLYDVPWDEYSRLLRLFAESPGVRLNYDHGELEIMSPLLQHDDDSRLFVFFVQALAQHAGLPFKLGGSTTLRRRLKQKGLEPDECFWLANAPKLAGKRRLDLRTDPPPDLAVEVEVTRSSLNRFAIYAALGIPEVWRLRKGRLTFHSLNDAGRYKEVETSRSFAWVTPAFILGFLEKAQAATDENVVIAEFRRRLEKHRN
jgi:Uma2 family endonuclease